MKTHPFFADINWQNLINEPVPWLPVGKDDTLINFPKANDLMIDEIINAEKDFDNEKKKTKAFENFEGVSY